MVRGWHDCALSKWKLTINLTNETPRWYHSSQSEAAALSCCHLVVNNMDSRGYLNGKMIDVSLNKSWNVIPWQRLILFAQFNS